jgi:hypothetical protein
MFALINTSTHMNIVHVHLHKHLYTAQLNPTM